MLVVRVEFSKIQFAYMVVGVKICWIEYDTESESFMPDAETECKLVRQYLNKMYGAVAIYI